MIESYEFGRITIAGRQYTSDIIVFPKRVQANWWRKEGHVLHVEDLETVLREKPDVLIVGTGRFGLLMVPPETAAYVEAQGIRLIVELTSTACNIYNELHSSGKVIAALHLTC
ncbi:MAG: MTH938/NDUFAF3 family protein [Chloroflexi bacterium]|nr:MTH938/NDUFAF3 family protein [Chloroflexota bacterium]MCL5076067.1 MTH938/NDUFAF3 family protein [Chloroflexota bacterium]